MSDVFFLPAASEIDLLACSTCSRGCSYQTSWNLMKARSPVERRPAWMAWPPVPSFSSKSVDGSLPSLVRNGPLASTRIGRLND